MSNLITEERICLDCRHHNRDYRGSYCSKLLMAVTPDMKATYKKSTGTCFEDDVTDEDIEFAQMNDEERKRWMEENPPEEINDDELPF